MLSHFKHKYMKLKNSLIFCHTKNGNILFFAIQRNFFDSHCAMNAIHFVSLTKCMLQAGILDIILHTYSVS